jgi:Ca2+/Na+ antiporter
MDLFNFYIEIFRRKRWTFIVTILLYLIFIFVYFFYLKDKLHSTDNDNSNLEKYKIEYFTITNQLISQKDSSDVNIETLKFTFNSVNRKSDGKLMNYGFVNVLEDYLVTLLNNPDKFKNGNYNYVVQLIKNEIKQEPFSQLPADQRRVLKNLESSVKIKDSVSAIYNLTELNDILINNNNQLKGLEKENNWSLPLGIVGLVVTILFGIMSILSPISYKKMRDIIEESVTKNQSAE